MKHPNSQHTAILIFANSSEQDIRTKGVGLGHGLFESLNHHTVAVAKSTGLPYFLVTEKEQIGQTFGERFANAINRVFELGFQQVITIGNDSPHLNKQHILSASKSLSRKSLVLGPSLDGGFYLMGLHKSHFSALEFQGLPWQTQKLYGITSKYFETKGYQVVSLQRLADIDSLEDIKHLTSFISTLGKQWIALFSKLMFFFQEFLERPVGSPSIFQFNIPFNKGSPASFA
nr:DUF2064 domain-containing protein [Allomuricauda sp.]